MTKKRKRGERRKKVVESVATKLAEVQPQVLVILQYIVLVLRLVDEIRGRH